MKVKVLVAQTPWTVACQAPLSVGFSWQEYWSGLPFTSPGDLPNPGIKSALQADSLLSEPPGKPKMVEGGLKRKKHFEEYFLVVQWLRLQAFTAGGISLVPGSLVWEITSHKPHSQVWGRGVERFRGKHSEKRLKSNSRKSHKPVSDSLCQVSDYLNTFLLVFKFYMLMF